MHGPFSNSDHYHARRAARAQRARRQHSSWAGYQPSIRVDHGWAPPAEDGLNPKRRKAARRNLLKTKCATPHRQARSHDLASDSESRLDKAFSDRAGHSITKQTRKLVQARPRKALSAAAAAATLEAFAFYIRPESDGVEA